MLTSVKQPPRLAKMVCFSKDISSGTHRPQIEFSLAKSVVRFSEAFCSLDANCRVVCLKGSKEPLKTWIQLGRRAELESCPSRHFKNFPCCCQDWACPAATWCVLVWHWGCQISISLKWHTPTCRITQVEVHTHTHTHNPFLTFPWHIINSVSGLKKKKKKSHSFLAAQMMTPHSFLLSCTTQH